MIPKRIFQVTTKNIQINAEIISNINFLKDNNPGWTYELFDEEQQIEFLDSNYPAKFSRIYHSFGKGYDVAKTDFFRYLLIYHYGGVYLDLKSSFTSPLSNLCGPSETFIVSRWPRESSSKYAGWGVHAELSKAGEYINGVIVAESKSPLLREVINSIVLNIESYNPFRSGVGGPAVLRLTGPVAYTLAIEGAVNRNSITEVDFFEYGYRVSIFEDSRTHIKLAKLHYGTRINSIIKINPILAVLVYLKYYITMKINIKRKIRRAWRVINFQKI